jgi:hypothetical protein
MMQCTGTIGMFVLLLVGTFCQVPPHSLPAMFAPIFSFPAYKQIHQQTPEVPVRIVCKTSLIDPNMGSVILVIVFSKMLLVRQVLACFLSGSDAGLAQGSYAEIRLLLQSYPCYHSGCLRVHPNHQGYLMAHLISNLLVDAYRIDPDDFFASI